MNQSRIAIGLVCLASMCACASTPPPLAETTTDVVAKASTPVDTAPTADHKEIMAISDAFHNAIKERDWDTMRGLFIGPQATCIGSFEAWTEEKAIVTDVAGLIAIFEGSRGDIEEPSMNHVLYIHDQMATLRFEYAYLVNQEKRNWGHESWLLTRVDGAWKIAAVAWSVRMPRRPEREKVKVPQATLEGYAGVYTHPWGEIRVRAEGGRLHVRMPWDKAFVPYEAESATFFYRKAYASDLRFKPGGKLDVVPANGEGVEGQRKLEPAAPPGDG